MPMRHYHRPTAELTETERTSSRPCGVDPTGCRVVDERPPYVVPTRSAEQLAAEWAELKAAGVVTLTPAELIAEHTGRLEYLDS